MNTMIKNSLFILTFMFSVLFFNNTVFAGATLTVDSESVNIKENGTRIVQITDAASTSSKSFTFTSNDTSIATVEQVSGQDMIKISAKNYGTTTVTVTSADGTTTKDITVAVYCSTFTVDNMSVGVGRNKTTTPKFVTGYSFDANNITYSTTDSDIISISGNQITGLKIGEATVTATIYPTKNYNATTSNVETTFKVTVNKLVDKIEVNQATNKPDDHDYTVVKHDYIVCDIGFEGQLTTTVTPEDATNKTLKYSSTNDKVFTVDNEGNFKAVGAGQAYLNVDATDGGRAFTRVLVEIVIPTKLTVETKDIYCYEGDETTILTTINEDATIKTIKFTSDNEDVATVDSNGKVTAKKVGNATILVSVGREYKNVKVTVMGPISKIDADTEVKVPVGGSIKVPFTVTAENNNKYLDVISFSTDVDGYITVDNFGKAEKTATGGVFTIGGKAEGFVIFTIKATNKNGSEVSKVVKVIVTKAEEKPVVTTTPQETKVEAIVPTINKVTVGKKSITVKVAGKGVNGYQIQLATNKKFSKGKKIKTTSKNSVKFSKLKQGKKYYVRVRSYVIGKDNIITYSAWSKVKLSKKVK